MMRRLLSALFALALFFGFANLALAQSSTRPGFSTSVRNTVPTPIGKTGIIVKIVDGYGQPVRDAKLVVIPVKRDPLTYEKYVDLGSAKNYPPCTGGAVIGCVQQEGMVEVPFTMLPLDRSEQWTDIIVRAEAPNGLIQGIWDQRRVQVQANGRPEYLAPIYMYDYGFASYQTRIWWKNKDVFVISTLVRSPYAMDVSVGISFKASSYTKVAVEYGQINMNDRVDEGWTNIEHEFYAPDTNMDRFGGSLCGKVQFTSPYDPEWVYDNTDEVCVAQRQ